MNNDTHNITANSAKARVSQRKVGEVHVLELGGGMDLTMETEFHQMMAGLCITKGTQVVVDCRNLSYMNSAGLGMLFHYQRTCAAQDGRFVLCHVSAKVEEMIKILGLHGVITMYDSLESALNASSPR